MNEIGGIHHITAISGDARENRDFYVDVLGMRLVKRSVNQDDPGTYHLFYADADGHPGTDLTFFPITIADRGRMGVGLGVEIALAIPPDSADYWEDRLVQQGAWFQGRGVRRGEPVLELIDPHGQRLALVATADDRLHTPWRGSSVPVERQIKGLHSVRCWIQDVAPTREFLMGTLGFADHGEQEGWHRFGVHGGGSGMHLEVQPHPEAERGRWGRGTMHHVAWRVADDQAQLDVRARVAEAGRRPTEVIDRFWFRSVYFLEPGGVLFELATDGPGFAVDEAPDALGERLVLPPWLEGQRAQIEAALPRLD